MLDVDASKVRASVVQLLRTVKEEDHSSAPSRPAIATTSNNAPPSHLSPSNGHVSAGTEAPLLHDVFAAPFGANLPVHSPLDLNTEFDFLMQGNPFDSFGMWGDAASGGWTDLNLLSSVDSTWPMAGPNLWNGGQPGAYY